MSQIANESPILQEIERKQARRYILMARISLVLLIILLGGFIYLFPKMRSQDITGIEPVKVMVTSVDKTTVKTNSSRTDFYHVKVSYNGKEYTLHDASGYPFTQEGNIGTAYLYNGKLYAKETGPATGTFTAKAYYVCLIGGFIMLIVAPSMYPKAMKLKKKLKNEQYENRNL